MIKQNPGYSDAVANLDRLNKILLTLNDESVDDPSATSLQDPLMAAFAQEEIDYSYKRYSKSKLTETKNHIPDLPASHSRKIISEKLNLIRKSLDNRDFKIALQLCSDLLRECGLEGSVFESASDVFLASDQFINSELMLLHSVIVEGKSLKKFVNLVSFACMRSDFTLAKYYLSKAREIDPLSEHLSQLDKQIESQKLAHGKSFDFSSLI